MASDWRKSAYPKRAATGVQPVGVFGHIVLFLALVALPAFWSAIAPLSVVNFTRGPSGEVAARVSTRLLFVVPYRERIVGSVTGVSDEFIAGTVSISTTSDNESITTKSEDQANLVIQGLGDRVVVAVSPASIRSVLARAQGFLEDATQQQLRLRVVANWKFGVIAGVPLSLLTVLYLYTILYRLWFWLRPPAPKKGSAPRDRMATEG